MMSRNRRKSGKHLLAALLFCLVMSMATFATTMVCLADDKGTVKVESAKIREKADTSSNQLGSVAKGGTVDIIGETTGADGQKWYQVYVNATTKGYLRADLVDRSGSASLPTVDPSITSSNAGASTTTDASTSAGVTPIEPKVGTVKSNNVNVRRSASTDSASIATVRNGVVLTVTGETTGTDSKKWYQVTFKYNDKNVEGFIRADLVTFDNLPADAAISTEITGSENGEGQTAPEPETRQEPEQQPEPEGNSGSNANENVIFMNVEEVPYVMPGFEYVKLDWNGQKINAYRNGAFFIVYAQKQNGEEGWYMLDKDMNVYQRYPYTTENVTVPDTGILSTSPILLIVAAAVVIILIIIIVILLVRLRGSDGYYEDYDDDDYPEDDDEIEELDDIDDESIRRPIPQKTSPQPVRRPAPQSGASQGQNGQPPRRPTPQQGASQGQGGQAPRRLASPQGAPQGQGGQPARRPVPQQGASQGQGGQPARRPAPQGASQGSKKPNPQNNRPAQNVAPQRGQKAKTFLENEDDDMDFIDI